MIIVLGILTGMPSTVFGREKKDSLILSRVYDYQLQHQAPVDSVRDNVYLKLRYNVERRNSALWFIPSMYPLAKGEREYIRESYSMLNFTNRHDFDVKSQVLSGTIRRNRRAMYPLVDLLTPNLYDFALYEGHILSPFNKTNRKYYKFRQDTQRDGTTRLTFKPKRYNTQLLNGYAIIETCTGRIIRTVLNGEYDMINFRTEINQGGDTLSTLTPTKLTTAATFRFMGNRITSVFDAIYGCPLTLPDSIERLNSRSLMDSIRPIPLTETDRRIYAQYDSQYQPDTTRKDTVTTRHINLMKKIFWDTIGDNLVTPIRAESGPAYFRLSPIINPLYLSYSHSHGLSYKMRLRSRYTFSAHRYLTLNPTFGYNFKLRQFYFTAPLRMTYNPKRNGYAEIIYGNGNRISNGSVADVINHAHRDTLDLADKDADKFNDNHLHVFNNIMLFDWLDIESGLICHWRRAVNRDLMQQYGMPVEYRSFAPMIGLKIRPWEQGPLFSIDWERGLHDSKQTKDYTTIDYERWELDASWKCTLPGLRVLNLRAGTGFYTRKAQNYFVDFVNFRDNNLPDGWEDEWSGDFELLRSSVYNESNYYIRANASYDSPMMVAVRVPYLGKFIERERFYLSGVLLERSRPYYEVGYSFTNRYLSIGMFAGFKNAEFQRIGFDFEFELFRRW